MDIMNVVNTRTKRLIAFTLALLLLWQVIPMPIMETYASEEAMMYFKLTDNEEPIENATIKAFFSETQSISLAYDDENKIYYAPIGSVSANLVSGTNVINVEIQADGYQTVSEGMECSYDSAQMLLNKTYDMHSHKLYKIKGTVTNNKNENIKKASIVYYKAGTENPDTMTEYTDEQGAYEISVISGKYHLTYQQTGYANVTKEINVTDDTVNAQGEITEDIHLNKAYLLTIDYDDTAGDVDYEVYGKEISSQGNTITIEEGSSIKLTAKPAEGYRLTEEMEEKMISNNDKPVDEGDSYSISLNTLTNWPNQATYSINFEPANQTVVKYDGNRVYYARKAHNIDSVSVSGNSFTINLSEPGDYPSATEGDNFEQINRVGKQVEYQFTKDTKSVAKITTSADNIDPSLEIIDKDNTMLLNHQIVDGKYQPGGGNNYWYINDNKNLYAAVDDGQSGLKDVTVQINGEEEEMKPAAILNSEVTHYTSINAQAILEQGSTYTLTATDMADNFTSKDIKIFHDEESPSVNSVSVVGADYVFEQNGVTYIGGSRAEIEANISDDYGIKNIYYLISDQKLEHRPDNILEYTDEPAYLEDYFGAGKFTEVASNRITSNEGELTGISFRFDATIEENQKDGLYIYVIADDFAGNINLDKMYEYHFLRDADAPMIDSLTDISEYRSEYKRSSDSISINGIFNDNETPSGMHYYVTSPKKVVTKEDQGEPETKPSASDNSIHWISFGNPESAQTEYDQVAFGVKNDLAPGSYIVWVYAKDGCGNVSDGKSYLFHIDNQKPVMRTMLFDVKENGQDAKGWFFPFGNFFRKNTVDGKAQQVTIKLKAQDVIESGAEYAYGTEIKIKDIKLYYVTDSEEAIADAYMNNVQGKRDLPGFTNWEAPIAKEPVNGEYTFRFNIPKGEVFYRLVAVATDQAGNCSYYIPYDPSRNDNLYKSNYIMLDQTAPTLTMKLAKAYEIPDYKEGNKSWYGKNKNVTYELESKDTGAGLFETVLTVNEKETSRYSYYDLNPTKAIDKIQYAMKASEGVIDKKDGHVTYHASVQDNAGNIVRKNATIYIDEDIPVITQIIFSDNLSDDLMAVPMQYGFFFRKKVTATVKATDYIGATKNIGSGVKSFTYYMVDSEGKKTEEKTLSAQNKAGVYTASFKIPQGFKGQIYVKATDNVNQSSTYTNPKGTVIESEKEHKTHSYAKIIMGTTSYKDANGNPLYNRMPTIRFQTKDTKSGILKNVWKVKVTLDAEAENQGTLMVDSVYNEKKDSFTSSLSGDTEWDIPNKPDLNLITKANKSYKVLSEKNSIVASLKLTDRVGNSEKATKQVFSVDMTPPEVSVEYDNNEAYNGKYYNKERYATITVVDANFSKEKCEIKTTGPGVTISEWEHTAGSGCNGSIHVKDCSYKCMVGFVSDGEYTFGFDCSDLAGWDGSYGQVDEFVIDLTDPIIQVNYDNMDARNGNYYKDARIATVQIEEHNFASEDVVITMTATDKGAVIATPSVVGWSQNEDIHTATIAYDYDGEFTFDIEYTDMADNQAEDYEQDQFVVDITEPEIEISGVVDRSANKGEVLPVITCGDTNMEDVTVSLKGVNNGEVQPEYETSRNGNSIIYKLKDLEHIKANDDIYTLHVTAIDKAGNEFEDEILYSVNRFGSVYQYDANTKQLLDDYYASECRDLVIKETNVNSLKVNRVTYSKDGEIVTLEEGKDYNLSQSGGEISWKEYTYTIYGENFTEEGKYILTLYSEDEADNHSDNKVKGKDIEFVIDKTAPDFVLSGVENHAQYNEETREFTMNVEDNIGLAKVEVYNDGELIASFDQETIMEANGTLRVSLQSKNDWQSIEVVTRDMAGNESKSEPITYLITTNLFVQWYKNTWAFYGSIGAVILVVGVVVYVIQARKKKVTK